MDYTYQIRLRRGTASQWDLANPILASGEPGYITDTNQYKIGDGVTPWKQLPIATGIPGESASIDAGETETGLPGTAAQVTNVGTIRDAIFDFVIPEGLPGRDLVVYEGDKDDPPAEWTEQQFLWDPNGEIREEVPLTEEESDRRYLSKVDHTGGILKDAIWWVDAAELTAAGDGLRDLSGNGRDAMFGYTDAAPVVLPWDGEDYVYIPDHNENYLRTYAVPPSAAITRAVVTVKAEFRARRTPSQVGGLFQTSDNAATGRGFIGRINPDGRLLVGKGDGTSTSTITTTVNIEDECDLGRLWHRFTTDGLAVSYENCTDGASWTERWSGAFTGDRAILGQRHVRSLMSAPAHIHNCTGRFYYGEVEFDGSLDYVCDLRNTSADYTTIANTGAIGGEWIINRAATGFKTAVVDRPLLLFDGGTNEARSIMTDEGPEQFSYVFAFRQYGANEPVLKYPFRFGISSDSGGGTLRQIVNAVNGMIQPTNYGPGGLVLRQFIPSEFAPWVILGVVDPGGLDDFTMYLSGKKIGLSTTNSRTGRIGAWSPGELLRIGPAPMEFIAAAIFDRALTDEEIQEASDLLSGKRGPHPQYALKTELPILSDEYPGSVGQYNNPGTSLEVSRADHVHSSPRAGEWETAPTWAALPSSGNWPGRRVHVLDGLGLCLAVWDGTGWLVDAQSDTGWHDIASLENQWEGSLRIRRVGSSAWTTGILTSPDPIATGFWTIKAGWRPGTVSGQYMTGAVRSGTTGALAAYAATSLLGIYGVAANVYPFGASWATTDSWPTTPPA